MCDYAGARVWVDEYKSSIVGLLSAPATQESFDYQAQRLATICAVVTAASASASASSDADVQTLSASLHATVFSSLTTLLQQDASKVLPTLTALSEVALAAPKFFTSQPEATLTTTIQLAQAAALPVDSRLQALTLIVNLLPDFRKDSKNDVYMEALSGATGPLPTCLDLMQKCTDTDVSAWNEDPLTFHGDSSVYEPDDQSAAAAECFEAFVHDLKTKKTFPTILPLIQQMVSSADWTMQKSGLEALVRVSSASPVSFTVHRDATVTMALTALDSANVRVQYQAMQLLGCLCNKTGEADAKSIQSTHGNAIASKLGPLISSPCLKVSDAACAVLISFCRGSSNDSVIESSQIQPMLPTLLGAISTGVLARMSQCEEEGVCVLAVGGINALACVADASKEHFAAYYSAYMPGLMSCMTMNLDQATGNTLSRNLEDNGASNVRGAAMEAATIVGASVGGKDFPQFVTDAGQMMQLIMSLLSTANKHAQAERDAAAANASYTAPALAISMDKIQRSAARISGMMEEAFSQFMPAILPHLLRQAKQKNEMAVSDGDEAGLEATNNGEVERDYDMGTESLTMKIPGVGIKKLTMNTSVVQEKSAAARAVTEHACALGAHFGPYSKICISALQPLVSFQYSAEVRVAGAQALAPVFDAACALAVNPEHACFAKVASAPQLPQQLFGSIVNVLVKQLGEERGEPETLVELATAISDVTRSAFVHLFEDVAGMHVAKLTLNEARSLVTKLIGLVGECLERRRMLFDGMASCGDDEDEQDEYQEALNAESDILQPLVDSIGYTLKCAGVQFVPVFDQVLAPTFGQFLTSAGNPDTRARFAAVCLFDDAVEFLGAEAASRYAPALLPGVLEGMNDATNDDDLELKQAAIYGVAQIARQAPAALASVAGQVAQALYAIIEKGAADEDEVSMIENSVSALASMCVFRGSPFVNMGSDSERGAIKELVLNNLPIQEDETEAHVCHDRFADMVEIGDLACVGGAEQLARTMTIIGTVLRSVGEGNNLAAPSTVSRFSGLLSKLQGNPHAGQAWGMIEGDVQGVIGQAVQGVAVAGVATITP
jgi:hypothetical protein